MYEIIKYILYNMYVIAIKVNIGLGYSISLTVSIFLNTVNYKSNNVSLHGIKKLNRNNISDKEIY